ncbi:MAG: MFS transporter [Chitinophagales bacterium]|nr:MFS transporter [Chitinophagales bacterium]
MNKTKIITRTIFVLSVVSLLNDISSEMLYPVMPLFLQSIGFSTVLIGVLEGFAEAIAGLSKMYFGRMSDSMSKRMPMVRAGYLLSAISKPMMAVLTFPLWVFSARTLDRLGKGIRTGARDALLSDETTAEHKATVFGFHRAFDTIGAATGPLMALIWLQFHPTDYKTLFLLAFLPAICSVAFTFFIREQKKEISIAPPIPFLEKFLYWKKSPAAFKQLMIGLLFFGLINSSDLFLLLRAKQITGNDSAVILAYILYNLVYALLAFPLGKLADRIGMKKIIVAGFFLFAIVYAGMSVAQNVIWIVALLILYGIYAAATEGVSKALISNIVPAGETASAIGFFTGWNSIATLVASSATGFIWYAASPEIAFALSAGGSMIAAIYLAGRKLV